MLTIMLSSALITTADPIPGSVCRGFFWQNQLGAHEMADFERFVNLTPHTITLLRYFGRAEEPGWEIAEIEPSGTVVRVAEFQTAPNRGILPAVNGVECCSAPVDAGVHGLPEPVPGVAYLVSYRVARAVDRADVFAPDTGPESAVRDEDGRIRYVRRLIASGGPSVND